MLAAAYVDRMRNSPNFAQASSILKSFALFRAFPDRVARRIRPALVACVCVLAPVPTIARDVQAHSFETGRLAPIRISQLPSEARETLASIRAGGPFASRRDGIVFSNRERILPPRPRGDYAEYTVPTPGARTRGARRLVAARSETGDFRNSHEYYYTDDHYQSFRRIAQ